MRTARIAIVGEWVIVDDIFVIHRYVCRILLDVCSQVFHVGETWEQFLFKYQDEGK